MTELLLIDPPRAGLLEGTSHGLASLADWVRSRAPRVSVKVLNWAGLQQYELDTAAARALDGRGYTLVGITTTTATYQAALGVARAFKAACPQAVVVLGGHHATPEAKLILATHPEIDVIVRGEGERPMLDLALNKPWQEIPGISYRGHSEEIVATPSAVPLSTKDLDSIGTCFHRSQTETGKFGRCCVVTARGCPLACRFCAVAQQAVRSRSIPRVVADIRQLISEGFREFTIEDNFFAQSSARTVALCEALADLQQTLPEGEGIVFDCQTRVESCSPTVVAALAKAGCDAAYLGAEALTPRQLLFLGKTPLPERFLKQLTESALPLLFANGIAANLNLQIGIPDTTADECAETLVCLQRIGRLARQNQGVVRIFPSLHVIYPGTPEFQDGLAAGVFRRDIFERFTEWEAAQGSVLEWMGRRFAHGAGGLPVAMLDPIALRQSNFLLLFDQVRRAEEFMDSIGSIDGIEVFDYTAHRTMSLRTPKRDDTNEKDIGTVLLAPAVLPGSGLLQGTLESAGD
jgi:anaerobic magnesium-protoporphyrin IX monomethyl ester cyclase